MGIFGLQRTNEGLEFRKIADIFQARVFDKERPAGEAGGDAAFEPFEGGFSLAKERENTGDLVVRVVGVAERFRIFAGPRHAL